MQKLKMLSPVKLPYRKGRFSSIGKMRADINLYTN